jgi:Tol biopolymer transport system component
MKKRRAVMMVLLALSMVTASKAQTDDSRRSKIRFGDWSTPVNLGSPVNSAADDLAAVLSQDELTLYFSSNRKGSAGEDIWVAKRRNKNANWETPVNLGPLVNSAAMDRLRSISPDGRVLLFQSNRPGGMGGNDIWASTRRNPEDDFAWGPPVNLGQVINTEANEIAANYLVGTQRRGSTLFFSSSRAGGLGDADIYVSEIPFGETFGPAVNVAELNSPYTEACFWVREDGLEIFFSSTRAALNNNLDSLDIWVSTRASVFDSWSPPVSLTVNLAGFRDVNPNLSADGKTLHFTSNRPGGLGGNDIYFTTRQRGRGN